MARTEEQAGQAKWVGAAPASDDEEIIPRDIRFGILSNPKRHWFDDNFIKTALVDGLSVFLPEGERYFIRSLKHFAPKLKDKALAAEINGYTVQEAFHTREHEDYNRAMMALGYDVDEMEKPVKGALGIFGNPLYKLASTCAIEHLTATFSTMTLRHPQWFDNAAPAYRRLWMWHALEELEHKAVALDVLKAATPDMPAWKRYLLRITAMNSTVFPFILILVRNVPVYAKTDNVRTGPGFWMRFLWIVLVKPGYWRACTPLVLKYYLPGFDPANKDDAKLVRQGRDWLYREFSTDGTATDQPR